MDHFAKPEDTLTIAQKEGKLQRNFQGYTTHAQTDLIAFGVSSISHLNGVYIQNHTDISVWNAHPRKLRRIRIKPRLYTLWKIIWKTRCGPHGD